MPFDQLFTEPRSSRLVENPSLDDVRLLQNNKTTPFAELPSISSEHKQLTGKGLPLSSGNSGVEKALAQRAPKAILVDNSGGQFVDMPPICKEFAKHLKEIPFDKTGTGTSSLTENSLLVEASRQRLRPAETDTNKYADMSAANKESAKKLQQFVSRSFSTIDQNADKSITREELRDYLKGENLTAEEKTLGELLVSKYDDLTKLTDTGNWKRFVDGRAEIVGPYNGYKESIKATAHLTEDDLQSLVNATSGAFVQTQVRGAKWALSRQDYYLFPAHGAIFGAALGGMVTLDCTASLSLKHRLGLAALGMVAGAVTGAAAGVGLGKTFEGVFWSPEVEKHYRKKCDIAQRILDGMNR